ncbi:multidrug effflux MFS transporter [Terrabacter sp. MAHUQ-38]|uniref:multidrug effflux MFS transporter n=1 Tax=unclassified Terrabacter TaxID=2630222 RepID=UPI001CAA6979
MDIINSAPDGQRRVRLALMLGALSAFPAMAIDMYLPGMPVMAEDLRADPGLVQLTVTVFVAGLAVGQVVAGPLSDAWGRRPLLVCGLITFVVGSLACLVVPTVGWLITARVVQSLGAAAATVLSRAVVRDHFEGSAMTRFLSTLMLVNGVATIVAPVVGGQLLGVAPWRAVFLVLAVVGAALLLLVVLRLPESLPQERRQPAHLGASLRTFAQVCRDVSYLRYVLAAALMFASLFAYISGSSFVLQEIYGLSAQQYSVVFAVNALGIALLGQANTLLVGRVAGEHTLLGVSLGIGTVAGLGVLVSTLADLPLATLLVCLFLVVSMLGPVLANATSLAMAPHASSAGAAASVQGVLQYLVGGLVASTMAALGEASAVAMGAAIFLSAAAALLVFSSRRRESGPARRRERAAGAEHAVVQGSIPSCRCGRTVAEAAPSATC